jgi:acetoin utilization protein AcuB
MTRAIDVMTERPVTVPTHATVTTAARILEDLEIRHLPVVDDEGDLVGMISDRDMRGALGASDGGVPAPSTRVGDLMNSDVIDALPDDELVDIAELMVDNRIGAVPIVDERGALVGIVSYVDVLRSIVADRK